MHFKETTSGFYHQTTRSLILILSFPQPVFRLLAFHNSDALN